MIRGNTHLFARALLAFAACGSVSQAAFAQTPTQCAPVSEAIVEDQFRLFTDAWAAGKAQGVAALFAPDAVLLATVSNAPRTTPALSPTILNISFVGSRWRASTPARSGSAATRPPVSAPGRST